MNDPALTLDFWRQIGLAAVCGAAIGLERQLHGKAMGVRTGLLICVATSMFASMGAAVVGTQGDPTRMIGQIAVGIGFLGGGRDHQPGNDGPRAHLCRDHMVACSHRFDGRFRPHLDAPARDHGFVVGDLCARSAGTAHPLAQPRRPCSSGRFERRIESPARPDDNAVALWEHANDPKRRHFGAANVMLMRPRPGAFAS